MIAVGAERQSDINFIPDIYTLACPDTKTPLVAPDYLERHVYLTGLINHYEHEVGDLVAAEKVMRMMMMEEGYIFHPKMREVTLPISDPVALQSLVDEKYQGTVVDMIELMEGYLDLEIIWDRFDDHLVREVHRNKLDTSTYRDVFHRIWGRNQIRGNILTGTLGPLSGMISCVHQGRKDPRLVADLKKLYKGLRFVTVGASSQAEEERMRRNLFQKDYYMHLSNEERLGVVQTAEDILVEALNRISPNPIRQEPRMIT